VTSRERVAAALEGRAPDRIPVALGFSEGPAGLVLPGGARAGDAVDVRFVSLGERGVDRFRRAALPYRPDTRLGTPAQAATYARWRYRPHRRQGQNPLARARSISDIGRMRFPSADTSPAAIRALTATVASLHARGRAVGGNIPHLGGELFESAWRLRGLELFLLDLVDRPDMAHELLDRLAAFSQEAAQALVRAGVDIICLSDDVGMPGTMMLSREAWRHYLRPPLERIIDAAREINPGVRVLYHSDGFYGPILDDLVEIGVDAINPLQPEHMDAAAVRKRYGPRLALWGTVGSQTAFTRAKPADIRREVAHRIETLGRAGLVLSPAYDVDTPDISRENLAAFLEAARELG
jgi:uroporphyrinogen decarboxylase